MSHAPSEYSTPDQCALGAQVLAVALASLSEPGGIPA